MRTREDLKSESIAIWVGDVPKDEFNNYLFGEFEKDFGFEVGSFGPEAAVEGMQEIADLLDGCSYCQTVLPIAEDAANKLGISEASCWAIFFDTMYPGPVKPGAKPPSNTDFVFLCNVPLPTNAG